MSDWNMNDENKPIEPNAASGYTENAQQQSAQQQSAQQQGGGAYSYGRYGAQQVPQSAQNGYYAPSYAQDRNGGYAPNQNYNQPQSGYYTSQGYTPPAYTAPKPPKKPHKGLKNVLMIGVTAVVTTALLLTVFWSSGLFNRPAVPVENSNAYSSEPSQASDASDPEASRPGQSGEDAFELKPTPSTNESSSASPSGQLSSEEVSAKVLPSVVCIENFASANTLTANAEGSGIVLSEDGYIITNAHVVEGAATLKAIMYDGTIYDATLVGTDTTTDLAIIKVEASGLTAAEFGDSSLLRQGQTVMAVGNPGGMAFASSVTQGIVSATDRLISSEDGYSMSCIQTDAAINPGNSGGPLVNMYGQVVGINSSKIVASGYEGLGFAISINAAQPILSDLKNFGYVTGRPYLGIQYQQVTEQAARVYGLPVGIYIGGFSTSTMSDAGCEIGDILTFADGVPLSSASTLIQLLYEHEPGEQMTFRVYRDTTGETFEVTVTLEENKPA